MLLPITIAVFCGLLISIIAWYLLSPKKSTKQTPAEYVQEILSSEVEDLNKKETPLDKKSWFGYWYFLSINGGAIPKKPSAPGTNIIIIMAVSSILGYFLLSGVVGLLLGVVALILVRILLKFKVNKRIAKIESQLPALVAGVRFGIQVGQTPQQALISQAEKIASPLGDELLILKNELAVNTKIDAALGNMSLRVPSENLKFLIASIRLSISSGGDLLPQLDRIQELIVQRTKISNVLTTAIASNQPLMIVSGLMTPGAFLYSYYTDEKARTYWGTSTGLITIAIIALLYTAGILYSRKKLGSVKRV